MGDTGCREPGRGLSSGICQAGVGLGSLVELVFCSDVELLKL